MLATAEPSTVFPVLTLTVCVVAWTFITRVQLGRMLSPISIVLLVHVSIFAVRPLYMIDRNSFVLYGVNVRPGFNAATLAGLVAAISLIVGYLTALSVTNKSRSADYRASFLTSRPAETTPEQRVAVLRQCCAFAVAWTALWLGLQIFLGGGVDYLQVLFAGRNSVNEEIQSGVPNVVGALPMVGALAVCLSRVRCGDAPLGARTNLYFWIAIAICVIPPTALGARRFLIPTLIAVAISLAVPRWRSIIPPRFLIVGVCVLVVLMVIPFVRSEGSRTQSASFAGATIDYLVNEGLSAPIEQYFTSYDTEMLNYIALGEVARDGTFPYGYGRATIGEFFVTALPQSTTPLNAFSDDFLLYNYGGKCGQPYCPVPSFVGLLMADLDLVGVVIGMTILGVVLHAFNRSSLSPPTLVRPTVFVLWAAAPSLYRGNTAKLGVIYLETAVLLIVTLSIAMKLVTGRTAQARRVDLATEKLGGRESQPATDRLRE